MLRVRKSRDDESEHKESGNKLARDEIMFGMRLGQEHETREQMGSRICNLIQSIH